METEIPSRPGANDVGQILSLNTEKLCINKLYKVTDTETKVALNHMESVCEKIA